jgi:hypothetical protein
MLCRASPSRYGNNEAPSARKNTVDFYGSYEDGVDMYDEIDGPSKQISIYGAAPLRPTLRLLNPLFFAAWVISSNFSYFK